jgi:hypothetical protein
MHTRLEMEFKNVGYNIVMKFKIKRNVKRKFVQIKSNTDPRTSKMKGKEETRNWETFKIILRSFEGT